MPGHVEDWLGAPTAPKAKGKRREMFDPRPIEVSKEEIDELLADSVGAGKKLVAGITHAANQLDAIKASGLTPEALVLLVQAMCGPMSNRHYPTADTVRIILQGFFRLREHLR